MPERRPPDPAAKRDGEDPEALATLEAQGLIHWTGASYRPTRRFRGAMMRAALALMESDDDGSDLRIPIATALIDVLGAELGDAEIARLVAAMLPLKAAEFPGASPG